METFDYDTSRSLLKRCGIEEEEEEAVCDGDWF